MTEYTPPKVWTWDAESGGRFASINRPIAGATHEKVLPVGKHPFQLYSLATPNGVKVTVLFEELLAAGNKGAEYDAWIIDISEGQQFGSGFVEANPNSKIPALMDHSGDAPQRVFESGAILLYLAEKFGAFLPTGPAQRTEALSWLFWQMGSAPYLGGGFGHFYAYAPEKYEYPINRYAMETKRQLDVLNRRLADHEWLNGEVGLLTPEEYASRVADALERLPAEVVVHRLVADAPGDELLAPRDWPAKGRVLALIEAELRRRESRQGERTTRAPGGTRAAW